MVSLPDSNLSNPFDVLVATTNQVPALMPSILFLVFMAIASAGYYAQQRRTSRGNVSMWVTISGLITSTAAIILFIKPGIVDLYTVIICIIVTIGAAMLFMFSNRDVL